MLDTPKDNFQNLFQINMCQILFDLFFIKNNGSHVYPDMLNKIIISLSEKKNKDIYFLVLSTLVLP